MTECSQPASVVKKLACAHANMLHNLRCVHAAHLCESGYECWSRMKFKGVLLLSSIRLHNYKEYRLVWLLTRTLINSEKGYELGTCHCKSHSQGELEQVEARRCGGESFGVGAATKHVDEGSTQAVPGKS